jgi:hypothetical protein
MGLDEIFRRLPQAIGMKPLASTWLRDMVGGNFAIKFGPLPFIARLLPLIARSIAHPLPMIAFTTIFEVAI